MQTRYGASPPVFALRYSPFFVALAGCTELVVLGNECRGQGSCIVEVDAHVSAIPADAGVDAQGPQAVDAQRGAPTDAQAEPPPDAELDAQADADPIADLDADLATPPDAARDAAPIPDSAAPELVDADVLPTPAVQNLSFELTSGKPGDVAAVSLPTGTELAPWFSCQTIGGPGSFAGVRAEASVSVPAQDGGVETVLPQSGGTFIAMKYFVMLFPPVLAQQMSTPLRAGTQYDFAISVRTSNPGAKLSLQIYGASAPCVLLPSAVLLAQTKPIESRGWNQICLRFTAPSDLRYFMLVENAPGTVSDDRLFVDDLRNVDACPD
jgi:hypothetical protein